jgi:Viral BACON domain
MVLFPAFYKQRIGTLNVRSVIYICITFLIFFIPGLFPTSMQTISSEQCMIPILQWEPKSYNFGYVNEGYLYQTIFEIWNNGSGDMPWLLYTNKLWISVFPTTGISSGEHDLVTVTINTTGLSQGSYEGSVHIHSAGDYFFYTYFVVTEAKLAFDPLELHIIYNESIHVWNTTFKLWNAGLGEVSYSLSPSKPWITVIPPSGILGALPNTIFVSLDISQIDTTSCSEYITINSTGGNAVLPLYIQKNFPPSIPSINGPEKGGIRKDTFFTITSTDNQSNSIWYLMDWGDNTISEWIGPYSAGEVLTLNHSWMNRGIYTIRCKARDELGAESDWATLIVTMPHSYDKPITPFLQMLFQRFPNAFPLLRHH